MSRIGRLRKAYKNFMKIHKFFRRQKPERTHQLRGADIKHCYDSVEYWYMY